MELRDAWLDPGPCIAEDHRRSDAVTRVRGDPPFVPLGEWFSLSAYRSGLSGFVRSDAALFWNVRRA
jgi:hypothetical protein